MAIVLGIGAGLMILIILWLATIVVSIVMAFFPKVRYGIPAVVLFSVVVTVVLLVIPRGSSGRSSEEDVDTIFFGRITILVVMGIFLVVSVVGVVLFHIIPEVKAGGRPRSMWSHYLQRN